MKTLRFSQVVKKAGKPEVYLLWTAPEKDTEFTKALKAGRVMTVHQASGATKTDYGTVGYQKGDSEQILIFPKSLKPFEGKRVVGMKYDLVVEKEVPKSQQAKPINPPKPKKHKQPEKSSDVMITDDEEEAGSDEQEQAEEPTKKSKAKEPEIPPNVKKQIQKAMRFLKSGKQVQAYEVLEELV
jgi:hypothetical protein